MLLKYVSTVLGATVCFITVFTHLEIVTCAVAVKVVVVMNNLLHSRRGAVLSM